MNDREGMGGDIYEQDFEIIRLGQNTEYRNDLY